MRNIDLKLLEPTDVEPGFLLIKINLSGSTIISKSGKSRVLATTAGNIEIPDSDGLKLGLTAYYTK